MVFGVFGEGVRPSHQATEPGPQGAEPAFDVVGFALGLAAATVGVLGESGGIGVPVVAAGSTSPVALGQRGAQIIGTLLAAVAQRPAHDLAGSSTQRHPQPERLRLAAHVAPEFIQLQHVPVLGGQERVHEGWDLRRFFPPARP